MPSTYITSDTTWTAADGVLTGNVYVEKGATLTIESGVVVQGSGALYINNDASNAGLMANGVIFDSDVYLDYGAVLSLGNDNFNGSVDVAAQLANFLANDSFPTGSTLNIQSGYISTPVLFPAISGVSTYSLDYGNYGGLYVRGGGTLTIANGNTIAGDPLYVSDNGSGGTLKDDGTGGVTFTDTVYMDAGATITLNGDHFISGRVDVAAQLVDALAADSFPGNSTVDVRSGYITTAVLFPVISGVSTYSLDYGNYGGLYVRGGGTLTIANGNTIAGDPLYVSDNGSGGTLKDDGTGGVTFTDTVYMDAGATITLSGDHFISGRVDVAAQLVDALASDSFPGNSTVDVRSGYIATAVLFPVISGVSTYSLDYGNYGGLYVRGGGTLTIANGNTIAGDPLYVSDNGSGGRLVAEGVTFADQLSLGAGSQGLLEFDNFANSGYNYFDGQMLAQVTDDDFSGSNAHSHGVGGPVNLQWNWWGTTDTTVIQKKIYDQTNDSTLPLIDFTPVLAAPPVFAEHLAFTAQPSDTAAGGIITPAVEVSVEDANNNPVAGDNSTVTIGIGANPGNGTLAGTFTVPALNGVATFSNLSVDKAGTAYTLVATDGSLTGATSRVFDVTSPTSFTNLSAPVIIYGTASTTISGQLQVDNAPVPAGETVQVTLNGVTQDATLAGDDSFSTSFATGSLAVPGSPYGITFSYAGDGTLGPASDTSTLTVNPATLTITPQAAQSMVYGSEVPTPAYAASGFVNGDSYSLLTGSLGISATSASPVGSYDFTLGSLAGANYTLSLSANPPTFAVTQATLTITANSTSKTYWQKVTFAGTEFTTSGLLNSDTVTNVTLTSAGAAITATVPGSPYSIVPSNAQGTGLGNYNISYVNGQLTVNPAPLTITANSTTKTYGQTVMFAGTEFTTSGLFSPPDAVTSVTLTSAGAAGTAAVSGSPYDIVASTAVGNGLANYNITYISGRLTVNPAVLTITPDSGQSMTYGAQVPALVYSPSGFVNGDSSSLLTGLLGTTATSSSPVGNYSFTFGTLTAGGNYNLQLAANSPTFAVTQAPLTITPNAGQSMTYGAQVPVLGYSPSGLVNGDSASLLTGFLGTTATSASPVGTYNFTLGSLSASANYALALSPSPPTFAVTQATPSVMVIDNGGPYTGQPYLASGTATGAGGAAVSGTFTFAYKDSQNNPLPDASIAVGTYTVVASFTSADPNYTNAVSLPLGFSIIPGPSGPVATDMPTFTWSATAGARHYALKVTEGGRVVLNLTKISGTTYTLTSAHALTPGQSYAWSVTPLNSKGKAIAPSTRVTFQVLPLGAPAAVGPTGSIATDRPTFTWTPVADAGHTAANRFRLTVTDTTAKQVLTITGLTGTSYTLTAGQALTPGHNFTWSVTAVSTNGKATAVSQSTAFTVAALTAPTGLVFTIASNMFSWQAVADAGHYALKVVDTTSGKVAVKVAHVAGTSYKMTPKQVKGLKPGHGYTWFVTAVSTNGKVSSRSTGAQFTM